jgi:hypothetical protein
MTATESTPAASTPVDLAVLYTPGQLDVVNELKLIQAASGLSDAKFAQQHLTVHGTSWMRIKDGTYAADPDQLLVKLETNLRNIRVQRAVASKLTGNDEFHLITTQQAAIDAVTLAKLKPIEDCERLVTFLAETGGGKTRLGRELTVMHDGIFVEGSEPWRKSYFAAVCDIAIAAGVPEADLGTSEHTAQRALLKKLKAHRRVLIIDEGEYFGPRTTNLIKLILNQTSTVVVILAIPELARRWQKMAWAESAQTNRRNVAVIEADLIFPEDVKKFAGKSIVFEVERPGQATELFGQIAKAANEFGRFSFVKRVIKELVTAGEGVATPDDVAAAIRNTKALLRR